MTEKFHSEALKDLTDPNSERRLVHTHAQERTRKMSEKFKIQDHRLHHARGDWKGIDALVVETARLFLASYGRFVQLPAENNYASGAEEEIEIEASIMYACKAAFDATLTDYEDWPASVQDAIVRPRPDTFGCELQHTLDIAAQVLFCGAVSSRL